MQVTPVRRAASSADATTLMIAGAALLALALAGAAVAGRAAQEVRS